MLTAPKGIEEELSAESLEISCTVGKIKRKIACFSYKDKETKQHILYCPSLEISGYGKSKEKAEEMFNFCVNEFFRFFGK